jgi:hypothetical protein
MKCPDRFLRESPRPRPLAKVVCEDVEPFSKGLRRGGFSRLVIGVEMSFETGEGQLITPEEVTN